MDNESITLRGVEFWWASLATPNSLSGTRQITVCNLTPEHEKQLKAVGIKVHDATKEDNKDNAQGKYVNCKIAYEPAVYDSDGKKLAEVPDNVGNGTKGNIKVHTYVNPKYPDNPSNRFTAVQITELVEYAGPNDFEATDGTFKAAPAEF